MCIVDLSVGVLASYTVAIIQALVRQIYFMVRVIRSAQALAPQIYVMGSAEAQALAARIYIMGNVLQFGGSLLLGSENMLRADHKATNSCQGVASARALYR